MSRAADKVVSGRTFDLFDAFTEATPELPGHVREDLFYYLVPEWIRALAWQQVGDAMEARCEALR